MKTTSLTLDAALRFYASRVEASSVSLGRKVSFASGRRFVKVFFVDGDTRSAAAFIERSTGDIYLAASWNAPAKGVRGNLYAVAS